MERADRVGVIHGNTVALVQKYGNRVASVQKYGNRVASVQKYGNMDFGELSRAVALVQDGDDAQRRRY